MFYLQIGFQFVSIVDSGKTIVTRGGRVSAQYEGFGIAGILLRMFHKGSPVYKPHIIHHAITGDMPGTLLLQQIEKGTFQEILTQVCITNAHKRKRIVFKMHLSNPI